eukprot:1443757-Pyramimonas_sp.AAC.1
MHRYPSVATRNGGTAVRSRLGPGTGGGGRMEIEGGSLFPQMHAMSYVCAEARHPIPAPNSASRVLSSRKGEGSEKKVEEIPSEAEVEGGDGPYFQTFMNGRNMISVTLISCASASSQWRRGGRME